MSRHRSTSTIITIRRRRREETHKIIRDNQFNGIHYRPRYNKSTITIPQNQKKKRKEKKKKKGAKIYPRGKKSRVTLIRSTGLVSIIEDNDRISRAYIESRRSAIPIGFNLITTLLLCYRGGQHLEQLWRRSGGRGREIRGRGIPIVQRPDPSLFGVVVARDRSIDRSILHTDATHESYIFSVGARY